MLFTIIWRTRQNGKKMTLFRGASEINVRRGILDRASISEGNIDSTWENHRHRAPESVHHKGHHLSTPPMRQHQQNVWSKTGSTAQQWVPTAQLHHQRAAEKDRGTDKRVRTRAGCGQAGSTCQHQHVKNTFCHAWSPQSMKANLLSWQWLQKYFKCNVAGTSVARDEHVSYIRRWFTGADLYQTLTYWSRFTTAQQSV